MACKGGSNEAIKKNPIISAVASSLRNIEKIIGEFLQSINANLSIRRLTDVQIRICP